jgi:hypothetical protein
VSLLINQPLWLPPVAGPPARCRRRYRCGLSEQISPPSFGRAQRFTERCATPLKTTASVSPPGPRNVNLRCRLLISRTEATSPPTTAILGWRYFGYRSAEGQDDADAVRRHVEVFLGQLDGLVSRSRISGPCSRIRPVSSASNPTWKVCASVSSGAPARTPKRFGRLGNCNQRLQIVPD